MTILFFESYITKYPLCCKLEDMNSYIINVIACPGIIRINRGVIPFQRAAYPSSLAIREQACANPVYLGVLPGCIT